MVEKDSVLCNTELNPLLKLIVQLFGVSTAFLFCIKYVLSMIRQFSESKHYEIEREISNPCIHSDFTTMSIFKASANCLTR